MESPPLTAFPLFATLAGKGMLAEKKKRMWSGEYPSDVLTRDEDEVRKHTLTESEVDCMSTDNGCRWLEKDLSLTKEQLGHLGSH